MENKNIRNIEKELLSDNWCTLHKFTFDSETKKDTWAKQSGESYDRGNGAAILLFNKEKGTFLLTKQFRMPTYVNGNKEDYLIEVCAGLLAGNTPEDCIRKETEGKTGYKVEGIKKLFEIYSSPAAVTEIISYFIAEYSHEMTLSNGGGLEVKIKKLKC
jgi:GDP-mannose pyrophosphatase NudK